MIVSNSSPLIIFAKINRIGILKDIFNEVYIPKAVFNEVKKGKKGSEIINKKWIIVTDIKDRGFSEYLTKILGKGEAEAIVLSKERKTKLLIDDAEGRKHAELLNLSFLGCLGVLKLSKERELITNIREIIDEMKKESFYIDEKLIKVLLDSVGEI